MQTQKLALKQAQNKDEKDIGSVSFELVKKKGDFYWKGTNQPAVVEHILGEKTHNLSGLSEFWKENHSSFAENFANTHFHHAIKSFPPKTHIAYYIQSRTSEQIVVEYVVAREK